MVRPIYISHIMLLLERWLIRGFFFSPRLSKSDRPLFPTTTSAFLRPLYVMPRRAFALKMAVANLHLFFPLFGIMCSGKSYDLPW